MSTLKLDGNANLTSLRMGAVIGGYYDASGVTVNAWYRLMPSGIAQKVANTEPNYKSQLNIGTLRADITNANLTGWNIKILNPGYEHSNVIEEHNGGLLTLRKPIKHIDAMPAAVQYVIYPEVLNPLTVNVIGANTVEFGYISDDAVTPANANSLGNVETGQTFVFPYTDLDKLTFRYATVGNTDRLSWGEHYIV